MLSLGLGIGCAGAKTIREYATVTQYVPCPDLPESALLDSLNRKNRIIGQQQVLIWDGADIMSELLDDNERLKRMLIP